MSNANHPDYGLVAHIYAAATAQVISRQDGPSFEEVLAQSIEAARVFAQHMAVRDSKQMDNRLESVPGMK